MTTDNPGLPGKRSSLPVVKLHDRLGEAEAQARAGLGTAFFQPHEAFGDAGAVGIVGNAMAVVGDGEPDLAVGVLERHPHDRLVGRSRSEYLMALSTMLDSAWPISSRLPSTTKASDTSVFERQRPPLRPPARRVRRHR